MDEYTVDAFVNRDEPVPVVSFGAPENEDKHSHGGILEGDKIETRERKRDRLKNAWGQGSKPEEGSGHSRTSSLQDKLFTK
jgi:hypothetical protein